MKIKIKKILLAPLCAVVVIAGVATFAAFEAHVINVTAHIENALAVSPDVGTELEFGTVFPQEYINDRTITVGLSESFMAEGQTRVDTVNYKIVQKPKPINNTIKTTLTADATVGATTITVTDKTIFEVDDEIVIGYHNNMERKVILSIDTTNPIITLTTALTKVHASGETVIEVYPDLCRFLSKMKDLTETDPDTEVPSYLTRESGTGVPVSCITPSAHEVFKATGQLTNSTDEVDKWIINLNVPPVDGSIGQDWPDSCADWTVPAEADYGCDLWIEVTGIDGPA